MMQTCGVDTIPEVPSSWICTGTRVPRAAKLTRQKSAGSKPGFRSEMKAPMGAEAAMAPCAPSAVKWLCERQEEYSFWAHSTLSVSQHDCVGCAGRTPEGPPQLMLAVQRPKHSAASTLNQGGICMPLPGGWQNPPHTYTHVVRPTWTMAGYFILSQAASSPP